MINTPPPYILRYTQNQQESLMCIIAKSDVERDEWIALIRNLIRSNNPLSDKYHPCQWSAGRWICCGDSNRNQPGCEPITWTPRQSKSDPVPPLPASVIVAAEAVAAAAARNESNSEVLNAALTSTGGSDGFEFEYFEYFNRIFRISFQKLVKSCMSE